MHPPTLSLLSLLPILTTAIPQPPPTLNLTSTPTHFALLLFPGFQSLDVFGPLDVFNTLAGLLHILYNQTTHLSIVSRTLAPVTTVPRVTENHPMFMGNFGESVVPTITLEQMTKGEVGEKGDVDVLLVPGGIGSLEPLKEELEFIKTLYPKLQYTLSVCTGSYLLARSSVLDNRRATTNKSAWKWATAAGTNTTWIPRARWVPDGNIWTSSGVSAGIDLAFAWVAHVYGDSMARYVGASLEYEIWEGGSGRDPFADVWEVDG